jgi:coenzyme F420-0:L-glutamate ligase / coenzyme F420-1:gamma-L-glutamate ligase
VTLLVEALPGLPEVRPGDDLAALLAEAVARLDGGVTPEDVLAVAHKVVSKAEGSVRALAGVAPAERARRLAQEHGKDPRLVQVILDESAEILRADAGRLICVTHHGFVCANAGVDQSNASEEGELLLLPQDPDGSAARLRAGIAELLGVRPAIVIADSFGRAWRLGQADVAIGVAGLAPLDQWIGRPDAFGRELRVTSIAVADCVAAAADLARAKDSLEPVVLVRGLERHVTREDGPGAAALRRPPEQDLFR